MMWSVRLAFRGIERLLGPGAPAFLAAEIGINHNGDVALAMECIAAAAESGADAVKFQNYRTEDFLSDRSLMYEYVNGGETIREPQFDMFKRCELSFDQLAGLADYAASKNIILFSTPSGLAGVRAIVELGLPLLKNASDSLTNLMLVRALGETGLPTVLSTGMATVEEMDAAVAAFRATGNESLVPTVCTSLYPTPLDLAHVRRVPALAARYDLPAGFSDHTDGTIAAITAVALGACFIEKHFTVDKTLRGPDHRFSASPQEFAELVKAVRGVEAVLGSPSLKPSDDEDEARRQFGISLCAARDLPAGHVIANEDIALFRPGTGLSAQQRNRIMGCTLLRPLARGDQFRLDIVEDS